jgi:hypothetical protein
MYIAYRHHFTHRISTVLTLVYLSLITSSTCTCCARKACHLLCILRSVFYFLNDHPVRSVNTYASFLSISFFLVSLLSRWFIGTFG